MATATSTRTTTTTTATTTRKRPSKSTSSTIDDATTDPTQTQTQTPTPTSTPITKTSKYLPFELDLSVNISPSDVYMCPIRFTRGFFTLFFKPKFELHRVGGLLYLIQFILAIYFFYYHYDSYLTNPILWTLPLNGLWQAVFAAYYFTFLPRKVDGGYTSDKYALSYGFVCENIFYEILLVFQWIYYSNTYDHSLLRSNHFFAAIEVLFVFLPYVVIRPFVPKSSFRESLRSLESSGWRSNTTDGNKTYYYYSTVITKYFYIWAKHYMGYCLNYVRFLGRETDRQVYYVYQMLLPASFATTIALFLHTLAFKHYLTRKQANVIYVCSYMTTFYSWYKLSDLFVMNWDLCVICLVGIWWNFRGIKGQAVWQIVMAALFLAHRMDYLHFLS